MSSWQVIQLAKSAGYADHKPPYDFKHGWVPISGAAKKATPKERKLDPAKPDPPQGGGPTPKQQESLNAEPARSVALRKDLQHEYDSLTTSRGVSNEESMAIAEWQNGVDPSTGEETYVELNDFLRHGKLPVADFDDDEEYDEDDLDSDGGGDLIDRDYLEEMDRRLRSALSKTKTKQAVTLFRGLRGGRPPLAVGDTITDKGYSSLTYDPSIARGFTEAGGPESKILVIKAPKGSPLLQVPDDFELELLAGPETPFKITKIDGVYVHAELVVK